MATHSMSKQSVAAGLSVCSKPHRWNSGFISARNKKKEKSLFSFWHYLVSPATLLEEKLSICGPPELLATDPRNEEEGGPAGAIGIPKNASRPPSIARGY
jgi:hypothetical protein